MIDKNGTKYNLLTPRQLEEKRKIEKQIEKEKKKIIISLVLFEIALMIIMCI